MGAESLTTALHPRPNEHYYPETHHQGRRPACGSPFRRTTTTPTPPPPPTTDKENKDKTKNKPTSGETTWSIKRFLGRHVSSRRYRVLEREPNRLRKRFTQ